MPPVTEVGPEFRYKLTLALIPMMLSERRSLSPWLIMWRTSSRLAGALTTFSQGFFRHLVFQHRFGQQALGIRHAHAAELAAPQVVAGLREAVPAAQLGYCQARFRFPQEANDLFFRKSLLHLQSPVYGIGLQS